MDCSKRLTPGVLPASKNEHRVQAGTLHSHARSRADGMDESHGGDIGAMAIPNHGSEMRGYGIMMANSDPVVPVLPKRRDESEGGGNKGRAQLPR